MSTLRSPSAIAELLIVSNAAVPTFNKSHFILLQKTAYFLFFFSNIWSNRQVGMANTHRGTNFITKSSAMARDGRFVVRMLATTKMCTKYEISTLTHYKDIKGD